MLLRYIFIFLATTVFTYCKSDNQKVEIPQTKPQVSISSSDVDSVDRNFSEFIEKFSKDTTFQLVRTKFPLQIKQYEPGYDKDTIIFVQQSAFEIMDFRKKESDGNYDQWKQEIVLDKSGSKAIIERRGIDNGIIVDYLFEKREGKWMLVCIDDSST